MPRITTTQWEVGGGTNAVVAPRSSLRICTCYWWAQSIVVVLVALNRRTDLTAGYDVVRAVPALA